MSNHITRFYFHIKMLALKVFKFSIKNLQRRKIVADYQYLA